MTYKIYDVVVVPFPFTDQNTDKRRPALVLSEKTFNDESESCVLAMITSTQHSHMPFDTPIGSLKKAGLAVPSIVRMKLFTLDSRLIVKKIGGLAAKDQKQFKENLKKLMRL